MEFLRSHNQVYVRQSLQKRRAARLRGPGCVEKAVERTGYADYWELRARHAIPAETTNYVPIILAMTIMSKPSNSAWKPTSCPGPSVELTVTRG